MTNGAHIKNELAATIIREGLAHGLLEYQSSLRTTMRFHELFAPVLGCLTSGPVMDYAEDVLRANPRATGDHRELMDSFVTGYEGSRTGNDAVELILDTAGGLPDSHFISLRTILGLAAFAIHRSRFPVAAVAPASMAA